MNLITHVGFYCNAKQNKSATIIIQPVSDIITYDGEIELQKTNLLVPRNFHITIAGTKI